MLSRSVIVKAMFMERINISAVVGSMVKGMFMERIYTSARVGPVHRLLFDFL